MAAGAGVGAAGLGRSVVIARAREGVSGGRPVVAVDLVGVTGATRAARLAGGLGLGEVVASDDTAARIKRRADRDGVLVHHAQVD